MKVCALSGKTAMTGRRTRHPHSGAWAHRAPKKPRRYEVNIQTVKVPNPNGIGTMKIQVAARMMTSRKMRDVLSGKVPITSVLAK